eukprot:gnl/TRDRNA2_/TRDRNA2_94612_c0_seq1.p1 gnl/TRDRNA2_/TRDRNA2_94612_c0~~gnl/TRDRNA2_/TRDRNA2_94612_c0_seq1.p1  ORF type:complete len:550 (+),score=88.05 gnl/TRDRNA2_/TRDRNA2_94612_c0_seq1:135-1652(+)
MMDDMISKFLDQGYSAWPVDHTGREEVMLGRPSHLGIRTDMGVMGKSRGMLHAQPPLRNGFRTLDTSHTMPSVCRANPRRAPASERRFRATPTVRTQTAKQAGAATVQDMMREIEEGGTPFDLDPLHVSEDVRYSNDLWSCTGRDTYVKASQQWAANLRSERLWQGDPHVIRIAETGPGEVVVKWEVMFVPEKLKWVWDLGEAWPGVKNILYDILDKMGELSRFSWKGLFRLFQRAALQGEMRIPAALIKGTSMLRFSRGPDGDGPWLLVSHKESIDLITEVNSGQVRNKRLCRDLLEYMEQRQPPDVRLEDWDNIVLDGVDVYSVPGMGFFEVEGLEDPEDRNAFYDDAGAVLTFMSLVVFTFGVCVAAYYVQTLPNKRMLAYQASYGGERTLVLERERQMGLELEPMEGEEDAPAVKSSKLFELSALGESDAKVQRAKLMAVPTTSDSDVVGEQSRLPAAAASQYFLLGLIASVSFICSILSLKKRCSFHKPMRRSHTPLMHT